MELDDQNHERGHHLAVRDETDRVTYQMENDNEEGRMNDTSGIEMPPKEIRSDSRPDSDFKDKYIVDWDGDKDPACPRNWSLRRKWENLAIVATLSFLTYVSVLFIPKSLLTASFQTSSIVDVRSQRAYRDARVSLDEH